MGAPTATWQELPVAGVGQLRPNDEQSRFETALRLPLAKSLDLPKFLTDPAAVPATGSAVVLIRNACASVTPLHQPPTTASLFLPGGTDNSIIHQR